MPPSTSARETKAADAASSSHPEQRPAWLPIDLFPFESRWLDIDGARVHHVDEGEGSPVLFLHGNPTYSLLYRKLILDLRQDLRCIALDLPGFGLSQPSTGYTFTPEEHARIVSEVIRELDLDELTVFGHDWGGPIGLWAAAQNPASVDRFVLANTWAWPVDDEPRLERFSAAVASGPGSWAIRRTNLLVNGLLPLGCYHRPSHRVMEAYRGPFPTPASREPTLALARGLTDAHGFLSEVEGYLPKLADRPTLLPWGARDPAFQAHERGRLADGFETSQTVLLEDASHYVPEDAPGRIAQAIRAWHPTA